MAARSSLNLLIQDLGNISPELRRQMRPAMKRAAQPIVENMKRRASWSTRIPGAIKISTSFAQGPRAGVRIKVDAKIAPHARPYESGSSRNRNLRHPVFAKSDDRMEWTWAEEPVRPFFFPAVRAGGAEAKRQAELAVLTAARTAGGFR
jgi:hypothetical protein